MDRDWDVIIIGGGPAGLTAGLYTARSRLASLLIEKGMAGGRVCDAELIENFPGFPDGISGYELGRLMEKQATRFGLSIVITEVTGADIKGAKKVVRTSEGDFSARAVVVAGGTERSKLSVPGEAEFTGKGVSYCATCDAAFFPDRVVAVVGGGNSAIQEALQIAKFASKVFVIHRRHELRAVRILQEKAFADPKMEFVWDAVVEEIRGDSVVKELELRNVETGARSTLEVAGVFVATGAQPNTAYLKGVLPLDDFGYIITNERMETGVPGVFAAGDIRSNSVRQSITAAGDGATAAVYAERFLAGSH